MNTFIRERRRLDRGAALQQVQKHHRGMKTADRFGAKRFCFGRILFDLAREGAKRTP
jgi:hypothetical protein